MANTYVKIADYTVPAGGAASIAFTSIPATYTDLCIKVSARCDSSAIFGQLMLEINSSGTITDRLIQGDGSAVNSYTNSVGELGPMVTGANATANTFGNAELYFPNYAGSANKSVSVDGVSETNATTIYQVLTAALRADTNPITSITLKVRDGSQVSKNFVQYSTAYLYGISKS